MSRPSVCFLTGTLDAFAGAERMTATIANALAERGYRVHVLCLWGRESVFPLHPEVRHEALFAARPSFRSQFVATVAGIRRYCRRHGIGVLVEVDTMLTLFTVPACIGLGVRRVAWEHCHYGEDLGAPLRRVARHIAARANQAIVVLTERDRAEWLRRARPRAPVAAIPNPLPFPFPAAPAAATAPVVLAVGRLTPAKGFDTLLRAWALARGEMPGWRLRIVGEGEERASLAALAGELGLLDSVTFPGATSDIQSEYRNAGLFCLSSRYEGFGLVLIEAMAFGLPVVSTDCEIGPREIIRNGENGVLVPVDAPPEMAAALVSLAHAGPSGRAGTLGAMARRDAMGRSADSVIDAWIALLQA